MTVAAAVVTLKKRNKLIDVGPPSVRFLLPYRKKRLLLKKSPQPRHHRLSVLWGEAKLSIENKVISSLTLISRNIHIMSIT